MEEEPCKLQHPQRRRHKIVVEDDEDDELAPAATTPQASALIVRQEVEPRLPASDMHHLPLILGPGSPNVQSLGMTQAFAATMAETQDETADIPEEEPDSMAFYGPPPEPDLPLFFAEDSQQIVRDSQTGTIPVQDTAVSHQIDLNFSQSQLQHDTLRPAELQRETIELNEIPDPTQDAGFALSSPAPERFISAPPSTVDTAVIPEIENEELPVSRIRGRLFRGRPVQAERAKEATELPRDAFEAMQERRKKKADQAAFDKKKSNAKEMVEEQAMESEDEYAGLGGLATMRAVERRINMSRK